MPGLVKKAQGLQRFMLDCGFWRSRKWVGGGLAAIGLQACGISYSHEHGTDGRLPKDDLALALGLREKEVKMAVGVLLKRGIWSDAGDAFEIVGYGDHNPLSAEVEEYRAKLAENGVKGNHEKWHKKTPNLDCRYCDRPPDRPPDRNSDRNGDSPPDRSGDPTLRSLSRVEESRVDPPQSPLSPLRSDPPNGCAIIGNSDGDRSNLQPPPGEEPEADEHPKLRPLAEHFAAALWPGRQRRLSESVDVVRRCLAVADPSVVDECIGAAITADPAPQHPNYLAAAVKNRLVSMGAYAADDEALAPLGGRS